MEVKLLFTSAGLFYACSLNRYSFHYYYHKYKDESCTLAIKYLSLLLLLMTIMTVLLLMLILMCLQSSDQQSSSVSSLTSNIPDRDMMLELQMLREQVSQSIYLLTLGFYVCVCVCVHHYTYDQYTEMVSNIADGVLLVTISLSLMRDIVLWSARNMAPCCCLLLTVLS